MDIGKFGKLKGDKHPRDLRKIDPKPLRATPKAKPHRKVEKPYGYIYTVKYPWQRTIQKRQTWFSTKRARDQSMTAHNKHRLSWWSEAVATERGAPNG